MLEKERGIPMDFMLEKIKKAIITGCKNNYDGNEDAVINIDESNGIFDVRLKKLVVNEVSTPGKEISLEDARLIDPNIGVGEQVNVELDTKQFGRIAAQTARNIIRQGLQDGERSQIKHEFESKRNQIISAKIEKIDSSTRAFTLRIGKAEFTLPYSEQIGTEQVKEGDFIKVYIFDVRDTEKGPRIMITRNSPLFVKKLFENEVPEIENGVVEIKSIARDPGFRTKMAVKSNDKNVEAIGTCIGNHGSRINSVIDELGGEKIDIIEYNDDPQKFISAALSPATVTKVEIDTDTPNSCIVTLPNSQVSLAIGYRGQNVRLAARLTGYKINIKAERDNL